MTFSVKKIYAADLERAQTPAGDALICWARGVEVDRYGARVAIYEADALRKIVVTDPASGKDQSAFIFDNSEHALEALVIAISALREMEAKPRPLSEAVRIAVISLLTDRD